MRAAKATDFFLELPDVGEFRYGRRTFGDRASIRAEILKVTRTLDGTISADAIRSDLFGLAGRGYESVDEVLDAVRELADGYSVLDTDLAAFASIVATHRVLCVSAPKGWEDLGELDVSGTPINEVKAFELFNLLRGQEEKFRKGSEEGGETQGA